MSCNLCNVDFKDFKVKGFGKMSSENILEDVKRANFNISCYNSLSNLLDVEDFQFDGKDIAEGVVAIKQDKLYLRVLYKMPSQKINIRFIPNNNAFDKLNIHPFKDKLLKMINENELPTELHYYSQECYLEFVFTKLLLLEEVGIRFSADAPVIFPNVWMDNDSGGMVFVNNACCIGSSFSGIDIAEEVRKYGLGATVQRLAYKFISSNMNFDLIDFSMHNFSSKYKSIHENLWDKLNNTLDVRNSNSFMFYLMLLFIHQNIKEGNINFLSNADAFYSKFADWVIKAIKLEE